MGIVECTRAWANGDFGLSVPCFVCICFGNRVRAGKQASACAFTKKKASTAMSMCWVGAASHGPRLSQNESCQSPRVILHVCVLARKVDGLETACFRSTPDAVWTATHEPNGSHLQCRHRTPTKRLEESRACGLQYCFWYILTAVRHKINEL